jgi:hypothetical protein
VIVLRLGVLDEDAGRDEGGGEGDDAEGEPAVNAGSG